MRRWLVRGVALGLVGLLAAGCSALQDTPPTVTPIYITATSAAPVLPIVATETPSPTSVLAATSALAFPTQGTRTQTPTPPPPITFTPTFTPTATDTPVEPGAVSYAPVGGFSAAGGAAVVCSNATQGVFATILQADPNLQAALGCPLTGAASVVASAYQPFQSGLLIWVSALGVQPQSTIYALYSNGTYQRYNDTWREGDPTSSGAVPPGGLLEPVRGFGKIWRDEGGVRDGLGWATAGEIGGSAQIQLFERGEMIAVAQAGQTYILVTGAPGTWTARSGAQ